MKHVIYHRHTGNALFSADTLAFRQAVEVAIRLDVNLSFADLRDQNLDGLYAPNGIFDGSDWTGSTVLEADLRGSRFRGAVLPTSFAGAKLSYVSWDYSTGIEGTCFDNAILMLDQTVVPGSRALQLTGIGDWCDTFTAFLTHAGIFCRNRFFSGFLKEMELAKFASYPCYQAAISLVQRHQFELT